MQVKNKILCAVVILFSLFACDDNNEAAMTPIPNWTYIRFVSSAGTNVLDSLNIIERSVETPFAPIDTTLISINMIRESDNQIFSGTIFGSSSLQQRFCYANPQLDTLFQNKETLVFLEWNDFKPHTFEKRPKEYNEVYRFQLYGPKIFGDDETHTLKWYADISGGIYDVYKCELDGREVLLDNDPFFNRKRYLTDDGSRHSSVQGLITINCK